MKRKTSRVLVLLVAMMVLASLHVLAGGQGEGGEKQQTVRIFHGYPEFNVVWEKMVAKDFMEENPSIKVEISSWPLREFERKVAVALPTGTAPELYYTTLSFNLKFLKAGLVNKPPEEVERFVDKSIAKHYGELSKYQGQLWGVPYDGYIPIAFWNKTMYEEAGLNHAPRTWEEEIEYAKKTTQYDADGNIAVSGESLRLSGGGGSGISVKFMYKLVPAGATILKESDEFGKFRAGFDNAGGRDTLQLYIDLVHKHKVDSHVVKHDTEAFALEKTAYFLRESWVIGYMKEHGPDVKYDTAPVPEYKRAGTISVPHLFFVSEKSKAKEAAWKFVVFAQKEKYLKEVIRQVGWMPTRSDIDYEDIFQEEPKLRPAMQFPEYVEGHPLCKSYDEAYTRFGERMEAAFKMKHLVDNPAGIEKVMTDAAKEVNEILEENGELAK